MYRTNFKTYDLIYIVQLLTTRLTLISFYLAKIIVNYNIIINNLLTIKIDNLLMM